ncbi:cytochrome oxidase assembly [Halorubrum sp. GN11_10-6_MGM]|uniref:COX15/CtaA family protein n=1 Tax=Halorubrum sp. GN11_10-6_MGM TaxID=2518112 RepID=UPI0010F81579|nr:COX15/CtaA family protein [Halorubrum sp. GN11_10-6_MGM]TKX74235.1 cytochrome oxidase assembly [Halorubrum sp. GN11_10-6_MGM]
MSLRPAWLTFRRYAAATTGMTLVLFSLGVYTAATGSGLACQAQWPLCSDQLIPALTINPDFIEWFHRAWAMVTGFLIIGVAGWTWLGSEFERRTKLAATLAVAILPVQITVGAITVTLGGLVPGGYTVSTHAAHLIVALTIFTLLGLATIWGGGRGNARLLRAAAGIAVAGIVASAVFSRAVPFLTYAPPAQAAFYITGLAGHLGLVAVIAYTTEAVRGGYDGLDAGTAGTVRALAAGSMTALVGTLLLGRDLVLYTATWQQINLVALGIAVALAAGAVWALRRPDASGPTSEPIGGD